MRSSCTSCRRCSAAPFRQVPSRRLVMLACDMYAMQFMEVAYELRHSVEFLVGLQPDGRQDAPRLVHWPYASILDRWKARARGRGG